MDAVNISELWRDLREAGLKARIVIPEEPDFLEVPGRRNLAKAFLADFEFFLDAWARLPADRGVARDGATVDSVPIADYDDWVELCAQLSEGAVGD